MRTGQLVAFTAGVLAALLIPADLATAEKVTGSIENQPRLTNGHQLGQIHTYLEGTFTDDGKLGFWAWGLVNQDWAEALVGLSYAIAPWCTVQAGVGPETDSDDARYGVNLWLGHGRWSMLALTEHGGSGHWRRIIAKVDVGRWGLGAMHQFEQGIGPRAEYRFDSNKPGAVLWTAVLINTESTATAYIGTRLTF